MITESDGSLPNQNPEFRNQRRHALGEDEDELLLIKDKKFKACGVFTGNLKNKSWMIHFKLVLYWTFFMITLVCQAYSEGHLLPTCAYTIGMFGYSLLIFFLGPTRNMKHYVCILLDTENQFHGIEMTSHECVRYLTGPQFQGHYLMSYTALEEFKDGFAGPREGESKALFRKFELKFYADGIGELRGEHRAHNEKLWGAAATPQEKRRARKLAKKRLLVPGEQIYNIAQKFNYLNYTSFSNNCQTFAAEIIEEFWGSQKMERCVEVKPSSPLYDEWLNKLSEVNGSARRKDTLLHMAFAHRRTALNFAPFKNSIIVFAFLRALSTASCIGLVRLVGLSVTESTVLTCEKYEFPFDTCSRGFFLQSVAIAWIACSFVSRWGGMFSQWTFVGELSTGEALIAKHLGLMRGVRFLTMDAVQGYDGKVREDQVDFEASDQRIPYMCYGREVNVIVYAVGLWVVFNVWFILVLLPLVVPTLIKDSCEQYKTYCMSLASLCCSFAVGTVIFGCKTKNVRNHQLMKSITLDSDKSAPLESGDEDYEVNVCVQEDSILDWKGGNVQSSEFPHFDHFSNNTPSGSSPPFTPSLFTPSQFASLEYSATHDSERKSWEIQL